MKKILSLWTAGLFCSLLSAQVPLDMVKQTEYVAKNPFKTSTYKQSPLPIFSQTKDLLPQPIFDEDKGYLDMYWKTWELAFGRFRQPAPGSPFVSNYIDEAFNEALFLWDTGFMTMFCNYAYRYVPGIQSLDNFYYSQMADGEIVREIDEITGQPRSKWAAPGTAASLNHPILAWAELESFRITNDIERLKKIYYPLVAYYYAYNKIKDPISGLYYGSWASMDNSPRLPGMLCSIDTSSEVVLFARCLASIAKITGLDEDSKKFNADADQLTSLINGKLWNDKTGFYYDLNDKEQIHNVKTIAGYWTLVAGIANKAQAGRLATELKDTAEFKRTHMVPTVPASEPEFDPRGSYWRGGVWTPTNIMVIEGLKKYGYDQLASEIALNHLENVYKIFKKTGTVWEFYQPDFVEIGFSEGHKTRADFTGWSACAPIKLFIEHKIGVNIDAPNNMLVWNIASNDNVGINKLAFGSNTVDIICHKPVGKSGKRAVVITAQFPYTLIIHYHNRTITKKIKQGVTNFTI
ncbi:MAG: hypothetical protein D4R64_10650 [Porphyromonadaceae bacterium]|nr:MAG: hypothetical protein D4R64_10650 [Porphyromonadaceae bacterium]